MTDVSATDAAPASSRTCSTLSSVAHARLLAATRQTGRPHGARDLIIAATAAAGGRTVVTADPTGFEGLPGIEVRRHR